MARCWVLPKKPGFPAIYVIHRRPASECSFFRVEEGEGGYMAYCKVLERYLTRSEIPKCERYWKECPYRRLALLALEEK